MKHLFTLLTLASAFLLQAMPVAAQRNIALRKIKAVKPAVELTLLDSITSDTRRKIYQYNEYGYITSVTEYKQENGAWALDTANSYRQEYVFDGNGRCTERTRYHVDNGGQKTSVMDRGCVEVEGDLTWERYYEENDDGKCHIDEAYAYDRWGNLVREIDYGFDAFDNTEYIREYKAREYTGAADKYDDHCNATSIKKGLLVYELVADEEYGRTMEVGQLRLSSYRKYEWVKVGNKLYKREYQKKGSGKDVRVEQLESGIYKAVEYEYTLNAAGTRPLAMKRSTFSDYDGESFEEEAVKYEWDAKDRPVEITFRNGEQQDVTRREVYTYADDYSCNLSLSEAIRMLDGVHIYPEENYVSFGRKGTETHYIYIDDSVYENAYTWNASGQLVGGTWKETGTQYEPDGNGPQQYTDMGEVRAGYNAEGHLAWVIDHCITDNEYTKIEYVYDECGMWTGDREYVGNSFDGPWTLEEESGQAQRNARLHRGRKQMRRSPQFVDDMSEGNHRIEYNDGVWASQGYYSVSEGVVENGYLEQYLVSNARVPSNPEYNYTDPVMPLEGEQDEWEINMAGMPWRYEWSTQDKDWKCVMAPSGVKRVYTKDGNIVQDEYDSNKNVVGSTTYRSDSQGRLTEESYSKGGNKTYEYLPGTNYLLKSIMTAAGGSRAECRYHYSKHRYVAPTGIDTVEETAQESPCYDLSGRRLSAPPAHGIFIRNGKKFLR
ncbi:MAG: hypothetical protein U0K56_05135 [Bacteroidaceae bacterium]|nr:hypothetical protein [Bacteroidaceae bacterium]